VLKYSQRVNVFTRILRYLPFLFLLIVLSCTEESHVLLNSADGYSLESLEDGTLLEPGSSVTIVLTEVGSQSTLIRVILEDEAGMEVALIEIEPELLKGQGLPMDLPADIEDGVYHLRFEVLDGDILLHEESRYFFIASGLYDIRSLETYPPGINPGDIISARVVLVYPMASDPWLRWSIDDDLIQEGFLSDIGQTCQFTVPDQAGVYSLMVELFPVAPQEFQLSGTFRRSDIFVTSGEGDGTSWALLEDRTYQYFIDFNDGMSNRMNPDDVPQVIGSPTPLTIGNNSGISFGENDGLIFNQYALPLDAEGRAVSFLMTMAFSYSYLPEKGVYNIFRTGGEHTYFNVLYLADTREFLCEFRSYSRQFHSVLPVDRILSSEVLSLEVQYVGGQGIASLSWKNNGAILIRDDGLPVSSLVKVQTVIGSDEKLPGFPMNWYTLGISSKNDLTPAIPQTPALEAGPEKMTLLYEKIQKPESSISVVDAELGEGVATLEIQSLKGSDASWTFNLKDSEGTGLYSLSGPIDAADNPESVVLSFINDSRGLFLSTSLDAGMNGPYDYQELLNFEILPVDGSVEALDDIVAIRLFRD
jgi:hypothetical protein